MSVLRQRRFGFNLWKWKYTLQAFGGGRKTNPHLKPTDNLGTGAAAGRTACSLSLLPLTESPAVQCSRRLLALAGVGSRRAAKRRRGSPGYGRSRPGSDSHRHRPSVPGSAAAPDPGGPHRPAAAGQRRGAREEARAAPPPAPDRDRPPRAATYRAPASPSSRRAAAASPAAYPGRGQWRPGRRGRASPHRPPRPRSRIRPGPPPRGGEAAGAILAAGRGSARPGQREQGQSPGGGGDPQPAAPHPQSRRFVPGLHSSAALGACP